MNLQKVFLSGLLVFLFLTCGCQREPYFEEGLKHVNGVDLYYKIIGDGEPIIFVHGGPGGSEHTYLLPQMQILADDYQLIFYDQRICGRSIAPTDSNSVTLDNFIEDLEGLRQSLHLKKMNLLGHSWGGTLAMLYAVRHPDRVASLVLVNSGGAEAGFFKAISPNVEARRLYADSLKVEEIFASDAFQNYDSLTTSRFWPLYLKPYFYDQDDAFKLNIDLTMTTRKNLGLISQRPMGAEIMSFDIRDQLKNVMAPTLLIHGDSDPLPLKYAQEINTLIPNSRLVVLENCGHYSYIEQPEIVKKIVKKFLKDI